MDGIDVALLRSDGEAVVDLGVHGMSKPARASLYEKLRI